MSYSSCPPPSASTSSTLTMTERLRRRDLSVSGAKLGTEGRSRCVVAAAEEDGEAAEAD